MFSGNWSLNVLKAKFNCVWERRRETEQSSGPHSHAYRCLGMPLKIYRQRMEPCTGTQSTPGDSGVRVSPKAVFSPHGPIYVHVFNGCFRRAVAPPNDFQQARQQRLPFNELQASEYLFRGLILSHRALYTAGTRLQWVTDP